MNGEITWLAIAECVVSIGIYLGVGFYRGTFASLAWAVAVAPLMLFRTDKSTEWGLKVYARYTDWVFRGSKGRAVVFFLAGGLVAPVIRILATACRAVRMPLYTLGTMPKNWIRQSLCTDLMHPPEILPGEAASKQSLFGELVRGFLRIKRAMFPVGLVSSIIAGTLIFVVCSPYLLFGYLPSILYRISFKATSLAYAPFVWVAHATLGSQLSTKVRLERFAKGEFEKFRRWFSASVLALLATKFGITLGWLPLGQLLAQVQSQQIIDRFVQPTRFPWWQGTLLTDALLTYLLLWFADAALGRLDDAHAWPEGFVRGTLSSGSFLRSALSILTMSHFCYLALVQVVPSIRQGLAA